MKLHTRAAFAAFLCSVAMSSLAQTTQPSRGASPTTAPTHPSDRTGDVPASGTSPSTPPTHPSERAGPTAVPSTGTMNRDASDAPLGDKRAGGSKAEAMQACKNLSDAPARATCMKKTQSDHSGSGDGSMRGSGSGSNRADMPDLTGPGQTPKK